MHYIAEGAQIWYVQEMALGLHVMDQQAKPAKRNAVHCKSCSNCQVPAESWHGVPYAINNTLQLNFKHESAVADCTVIAKQATTADTLLVETVASDIIREVCLA